jgi:hypothetical protein
VNFKPRDIAYVVAAPSSHTGSDTPDVLWVITSSTWLRGWEINRRVRIVTGTRAINVTIRGIMDFAAVMAEGKVPNVHIVHWRCEKQW